MNGSNYFHARRAASLVIVSLIVIALILIVGIGAIYIKSDLNSSNTTNVRSTTGNPFLNPYYLSKSSGVSCIGTGGGFNGTDYPAPCFSSTISEAYVFNCASTAASLSGCQARFNSTLSPGSPTYTITVWYPITGETGESSLDNCKFVDSPQPSYGYCISLNSTSFILSIGGPGP